MKYYLGDKLLFVDMIQHYTHCIVEGEDRVICCLKSFMEARQVCINIKSEKEERINAYKELLDKGHAYSDKRKSAYGLDPKELYPTAGILHSVIKNMERNLASVRVEPLIIVE